MENLEPLQLWLLIVVIALAAFQIGRVSAGNGPGGDREERQMRLQQEAEQLFISLSPTAQLKIDQCITGGKMLEAVKIVRDESGAGLRQAKLTVDYRRRALGAHS